MRAVLIICILAANISHADVGGSMQGFWKDMGGVVNVNKGGAYEGQTAGYYSLGSVYARTPVKSVNPISIQLPSASGSCSDINMFNGAMSFINSEQLVGALKAVANNAKGFAFQLALETVSPVIAEKVEELQGWAQKINSLNINSCEMAQTLVGGVWPRHEHASKTICSVMSGKSGIGKDFLESKHGCQKNQNDSISKISGKDKEGLEKLWIEDVNLAWKSLKDSGFFKSDSTDDGLKEMFMTMSGTIIINSTSKKGDKAESAPSFQYIGARAVDADVITTLLEGGEIKVLKCNEKDKCLGPTEASIKITEEQAFKSKVQKLINSIVDKIIADEALTEEEKSFLNYKINIPLYKVLTVYAAYSGGSAMFELPAYVDAISLQIIYRYLEDLLTYVERASDTLMIADEDHVKEFKKRIRDTKLVLNGYQLKNNQNLKTLMTLVNRTQMIEGLMTKGFSGKIAESTNWADEL